jgi:Integrase
VRRLSSPSQYLTWDHRSAVASLRLVDQTVISKVPECKRAVPSNHSVVSIGTTAYLPEDHERKNAYDQGHNVCANWKARQIDSYGAQARPASATRGEGGFNTHATCLSIVLSVLPQPGSVSCRRPCGRQRTRRLGRTTLIDNLRHGKIMSQNPNVSALVHLPERLVEDLVTLLLPTGHARERIEMLLCKDSNKTSESPIQILVTGFKELRAGGYALTSPWSVREKHIRYLMHLWVDKSGQGPTVVLSKLTHWRNLARKMRKTQLLAIVEDYIKKPGGYGRHDAQQNGTTGDQLYIHVDDAVARLAEQDRWVSVQVELQCAFNLRPADSMLFRPLQFLRLSGQLHIPDGTRGGRPRVITLNERWQYDLLLRAARLSRPTNGVMYPAPWTLKRWYRHYYAVLRSQGLSRTVLGVTISGLRNAYAQRMADPSQSREHSSHLFVDHPQVNLNGHARRAAMLRLIESVDFGLTAESTRSSSTIASMRTLKTLN